MFLDRIVDVEEYRRLVLVGLVLLNLFEVLLRREILVFGVFPQHEILGFLGELLVGQDAVLNENFQIVPLGLVVGAHG